MLRCKFVEVVTSVDIKERQPGWTVKSQNAFVLGMDGGQHGRQLPQQRNRGRLIIHKHPALAADSDLALDDDVAVFRFHAIFFQYRPYRSFIGVNIKSRLYGS